MTQSECLGTTDLHTNIPWGSLLPSLRHENRQVGILRRWTIEMERQGGEVAVSLSMRVSVCVQQKSFWVLHIEGIELFWTGLTSLNSWIWACSNMENTLELAPSAALFLAFFGAFWNEEKKTDKTLQTEKKMSVENHPQEDTRKSYPLLFDIQQILFMKKFLSHTITNYNVIELFTISCPPWKQHLWSQEHTSVHAVTKHLTHADLPWLSSWDVRPTMIPMNNGGDCGWPFCSVQATAPLDDIYKLFPL